jgi:hypothetical protein
MQLLVHQLTRMGPGRVCVAGLEEGTDRHVRPVLPCSPLPDTVRAERDGAFALGAVVDIGDARPRPAPPRREDVVFRPAQARRVRHASPAELWARAQGVARTSLASIFGEALGPAGSTLSGTAGVGEASLGVWQPRARPRLVVNGWGKVRLNVQEGGRALWLPVTDRRFFAPDHETPLVEAVTAFSERIRRGTEVLLGVGLSSPYAKAGEPPRMWLQVNSVLLAPAAGG